MKSNKIWSILILAILIIAGFSFGVKPGPAFGQVKSQQPDVEPELLQQIQTDEASGYMIYFRDKADLSLAYDLDWDARGKYVVRRLQENAEKSQAKVVQYLNSQGADFQAFWIDNIIIVNSSNQNTFNGLMGFPEIESLRARQTLRLIEPIVDESENRLESVLAVEPNIAHVLAPDVWGLGITGDGMVVANIDTGVRASHDALVRQYRGTDTGSHDYNWLGAAGGSAVPVDDHGHGTHTMGTIVGEDSSLTNQIGLAPGAKWIACDGCEGSGCTDAALLACAQWITAPYPIGDPSSPDPSKRPHVVNNSWGDCGTSYDNWYQASVDAWHAAGIFPIFSNGNASNCGYSSPPGLNTVGNPARYGNVTGVGSSGESNGLYATHSNWGPTDNLDIINAVTGWENLKPQVLAPGVSIRSSTPGSDSEYQDGWSGTSMSAPHVTGLVALMWQAAPCLVGDYAITEKIIEETANPIPYDDGTGSGPSVPNYATGWGEINALAAVQRAQTFCGGGVLTGTVTDNITSDGLVGAIVHAESISYTYQTTSDDSGIYSQQMITGTYDVTALKYGYQPITVSAIPILDGITTTLDFSLSPVTFYTVTGKVSDDVTNWPLYAQISISGDPVPPTVTRLWTDPVTGEYEIRLAEGITYTFEVEAWVPGYNLTSRNVGPLSGNTTEDFHLVADVTTCTAPGYKFSVIDGISETFDVATLPAGWTVVNNGGSCNWQFDDPGGRGNLTGGTGNFAIADSDACGSGTTMDTYLYSPVVDLSAYGSVPFEFKYDYNNFSGSEVAAVDFSSDGGDTWTNLVTWNTDQRGPATYSQNLTALAGGTTEAQLRFHYLAPGWDWWWEVDDVLLGGAPATSIDCVPPTGGLVVGHVFDENTSEMLNGAMVENEIGDSAEAVPTPLDENVLDAFYTIYAPAGNQTFTATMSGGYAPEVQSVNLGAGKTESLSFNLSAGWLEAVPAELHAVVDMGEIMTQTFDLVNHGFNAAEFTIEELNGSPDVPWLATDPITGTVASAGLLEVEVTFDASVLEVNQPGEYLATLSILNDTPYGPASVPVTMTVNTPPSFGRIIGTVASLGYCDQNSAPIEGAEVTIEGATQTVTLTTDIAGSYSYYLDASEAPLNIQVTATDHVGDSVSGIGLTAGQTTTQDFDLRSMEPCVSVDPATLAITLPLEATGTLPLNLFNNGASATDFAIYEIETIPVVVRKAAPSAQDAKNAPVETGFSTPSRLLNPQIVLLDEGFESGNVPPSGWTTQSQNASYSWKIMTLGTPYNGSYSADVVYDPGLNPQDEWLISSELVLSEGILSFWSMGSIYWCRDDFDNCDLNVWIVVGDVGGSDDILVGSADADWPDNFVWAQSTFNLTSQLPGGPVRIGFQYVGTDGAQIGLDDILLDGMEGLDIDWLSTDPISGTLVADGNEMVDVNFDTLSYPAGTYNASLRISTSDPTNPVIAIPVRMVIIEEYKIYLRIIHK